MLWSYFLRGSCFAAMLCLIAACGGSSVAAGTGGTNAPPAAIIPPAPVIQGISTPESVAVVTATNAVN